MTPSLEQTNTAVDFLLNSDRERQLHAFISVIWYHAFLIVHDHIVENPEGIISNLGRQKFTEATSRMHELFLGEHFASYVCAIFETNEPTDEGNFVAVDLVIEIYWNFLRHLDSSVRRDHESEGIPFSVEEMNGAGKAKVRHVGGWAVRKILTRYRKHVQRNAFSAYSSTLVNVEKKQKLCELLEENVIIPYAKLAELTKYPETLEVTEQRQYRERGLLHISDDAYLFFIHLEGRRLELLNLRRLQQEKGSMVEAAMKEFAEDETIKLSWRRCFATPHTEENTVSVLLKSNLFENE